MRFLLESQNSNWSQIWYQESPAGHHSHGQCCQVKTKSITIQVVLIRSPYGTFDVEQSISSSAEVVVGCKKTRAATNALRAAAEPQLSRKPLQPAVYKWLGSALGGDGSGAIKSQAKPAAAEPRQH
ncbi:hypothetical protein K438DRAFT_1785179 [Mycena galopus ATCC 62051]|nr:hypothetical protein K438DRAFT_1785179 [Mycena galopus ATCC 62051]